ncbi:hypothetical protein HK103_006007 [Boothiomyces macroporosus]|uniref:Uncharacterized protein n=1 Tax=Boothiomyces macroporosus TaxID=261099 RepID=A0AAD5UME4_9FUNG|nr:hypothetical protein HK103_006007 [Boothiomyces macroporosus]
MHLQARLSNGTTLPINTSDSENTTVSDLKDLIAAASGESVEGMRLVCKGRILNGDQDLLSIYSVSNNDIIHVAKARQSEQRTTPVTPRANRNYTLNLAMEALTQSPMVQSLLSNPQFLQSMLQSDPRFQQLAQDNPEVQRAMTDPSFLREISAAARNPRLMQEMMRNQEEANKLMAERLGAVSPSKSDGPNTLALPNPWNPQRNITSPSNISLIVANRTNLSPSTASPAQGMPFSPMGFNPYLMNFPPLSQATAQPQTQTQAANPQAMFQQMAMMQQMMRPVQSPAPVSQEPVEVRYREQLATLREMGFTDEEKNKRAILAAGGNTDAAIEFILNQ